jgi:hypothetical protein
MDMLAAEMDLLMKKFEGPAQEATKAMYARMTCEVCGNSGHSGNDCHETRQDAHFVGNNNSNGYRPNNFTTKAGIQDPTLP